MLYSCNMLPHLMRCIVHLHEAGHVAGTRYGANVKKIVIIKIYIFYLLVNIKQYQRPRMESG